MVSSEYSHRGGGGCMINIIKMINIQRIYLIEILMISINNCFDLKECFARIIYIQKHDRL